jgi:hypothetical protein
MNGLSPLVLEHDLTCCMRDVTVVCKTALPVMTSAIVIPVWRDAEPA